MDNKPKLKLKLKQLFCHHEWELINEERFSDTSQGYRAECYSVTISVRNVAKLKSNLKGSFADGKNLYCFW